MRTLTVVPAYGRDYPTAAAATRDWTARKDFRIRDVGCPFDGAYVGAGQVGELLDDGYTHLHIRHNQLADVAVLQL